MNFAKRGNPRGVKNLSGSGNGPSRDPTEAGGGLGGEDVSLATCGL